MAIPASELILNGDGSVYHLNLRPEHLAERIITVGDPDRVRKVSQYFDHIEFQTGKREFITHTGVFAGKRISVISTGMGTDNIEILMNELDALVNINLATREIKAQTKALEIVRIGTSGSLSEAVDVDAHLASARAMGIDSLMHFYQLPQSAEEKAIAEDFSAKLQLGFVPYVVSADAELLTRIGGDMVSGTTLTCPGFYAPQGRELRLKPKIDQIVRQYAEYQGPGGFALTNFEMETAGYYSLGRLLGHKVLSVNAIVAHRLRHQFSADMEATTDSLIRKVLERI